VQLLLQLGVTLARSIDGYVSDGDLATTRTSRKNILDTTGVQRCAIHRSSNHVSEGSRVVVVVALFRDLLLDEVSGQRTGRLGAAGGYIIVAGRGHGRRRYLV
jgi:hypothetical protein